MCESIFVTSMQKDYQKKKKGQNYPIKLKGNQQSEKNICNAYNQCNFGSHSTLEIQHVHKESCEEC